MLCPRSIQKQGLWRLQVRANAGAMLGPGLYVTTTLQKASTYAMQGHRPNGGMVFRLNVNLGNGYTIKQIDPYMSTWQQKSYDSA